MSLKDLFRDKKNLSGRDLVKSASDIEEPEYIKEVGEDRKRLVPHLDYSDPKNFARYGLAEKYYEDSFNRITRTYPFDGSGREKQKWYNESSYIDLYIFENEYPRRTGYATFVYDSEGSTATYNGHTYASASTPSFIYTKGVMNTGSYALKGNTMTNIASGFSGSNEYDVPKDRYTNLRLSYASGSTVEFWMKRGEQTPSSASVVFDIWNGKADSSDQYGRLTLELAGSPTGSSHFLLTCQSGTVPTTNGIFQETLGSFTGSTDWHHYALSTYNTGSDLRADLYVDGQYNASVTESGESLGEVSGSMTLTIGCFENPPSGSSNLPKGFGNFSGSLDEFRFWRKNRESKGIKRFWFCPVDGGSDTDDIKTDLGVYYKFNEGITQTASLDSVVLDYSGRTSNGRWINYASVGSRNTGSAIISASASPFEFEDPIVWPNHPSVLSKKASLKLSGSSYDLQNNTSIYYTYPSWIIEEDGEDGELRRLSQIIGSYFDELHSQIKELPKLKGISYISGSDRPYPFVNRILSDKGVDVPELFSNADELAQLFNRSETKKFEKKLFDTKNTIYTNIYNNIVDIQKSKGTEKSVRNLLRCFGVDEKLIKTKYYADQEEYEIRDNYQFTSIPKKLVNFNRNDNFNATLYQQSSSVHPESVSYISGSGKEQLEKFIPMTVEAEITFPRKFEIGSEFYNRTSLPSVSSSLFGLKTPVTGVTVDLWQTGSVADFRVFAVRDRRDEDDVYFTLESDILPTLTSSWIEDVYNDSRWNFGVRVYPDASINAGLVDDSSSTTGRVEFYGVNQIVDEVVNEFEVTGTISSANLKNFLSSPKRLYAGAYRTNWTGSVIQQSDVKIGAVRYWANKVNNETIKLHNRDPENYGNDSTIWDTFVTSGSIDFSTIPDISTLALNWDFTTVTSSDASGQFLVNDITSGSSVSAARNNFLGGIIGNQHTGRAYGFPASSTNCIDKDYLISGKQKDPESIGSFDMVKIRPSDEVTFTQESRPIKHTIRFEKSMYSEVSDQMLNWLGSIKDFNNAIGAPSNKYAFNYRYIDGLRRLFFEKVGNTPDLEKYVELYKWLDSAISKMLIDLVPASAQSPAAVDNVVESHIFERDKYWHKYPTLESKQPNLVSPFKAGQYFKRQWKYTHSPVVATQSVNLEYWQKYSEPGEDANTANNVEVDAARQRLFSASYSTVIRNQSEVMDLSAESDTFQKVKLYREYPFEFYRTPPKVEDNGPIYPSGEQRYYAVANTSSNPSFNRDDYPLNKERYPLAKDNTVFKVFTPTGSTTDILDIRTAPQHFELLDAAILPFTPISTSVDSGYVKNLAFRRVSPPGPEAKWGSNVEIVNKHRDLYSSFNQEPMQSPFTSYMVGGSFHRSQEINSNISTEASYNRSEGYYLFPFSGSLFLFSPTSPNTIARGFQSAVGLSFIPETLHQFPLKDYYRDEGAKRPVNLRNKKIQTGSTIIGNFEHNYELINGAENNQWFRENYESLGSVTPEVANLTGNIDYAIHPQSGSETFFKNRFSAPGSSNETSLGYLDPQTQQYGVYSTQTYRNLAVRKTVTEGLSEHFDIKTFGVPVAPVSCIISPDGSIPSEGHYFCQVVTNELEIQDSCIIHHPTWETDATLPATAENVGTGADGTYTGASLTLGDTAPTDSGLLYGTTGTGRITTPNSLDTATANYTIQFWFKGTVSAGQGLVGKSAGSDRTPEIYRASSVNTIRCDFFDGSTLNRVELNGFLDDAYHCVVLRMDRDINEMEVWVDGTSQGSVSITATPASTTAVDWRFRGGYVVGDWPEEFAGPFVYNIAHPDAVCARLSEGTVS